MLKRPLLVAVFILTCSCQGHLSQAPKKISYIIYGVYYSECGEDRATMFKLESDRLLVDSTDSYFGDNLKVPHIVFSNKTLPRDAFKRVQLIRQRFPDSLLLIKDKVKVFGCPDCSDQGGIFLEIKFGNEIKTFKIDTQLDKIPANLRGYAKLVMDISRSPKLN